MKRHWSAVLITMGALVLLAPSYVLAQDTDGDGMPDSYENTFGCLEPNTVDNGVDYDTDGMTSGAEYAYSDQLDPCAADTDGDGHPDGNDCNPLDPNNFISCATCLDADLDGSYLGCDAYVTILGPDCNDTNTYSWDTCSTCVDSDADSSYGVCNRYTAVMPFTSTVGTGFINWAYPLITGAQVTRTQAIYLASEIGRAGTINAVALDVTTIPFQVMNNFTIRMKHTNLSQYLIKAWEGPDSGWTTVYQANEPPGTIGWHIFTLNTPFVFNGTSNLMVDFSFNNSSSSHNGKSRATNSGAARSIAYPATNSFYGDPLNWTGTSNPSPGYSNDIPNLRFSIQSPFILNGPDCNDADPNVWDTCATCGDDDSDSWFDGCNDYLTVPGPDCNDADDNAWNTCASCVDNDGDGYHGLCNAYNGINGPDCADTNTNVWDTCGSCADGDGDTWFAGCNRYLTITGPDCDDDDVSHWDDCGAPDSDGDGLSDDHEINVYFTDPGDPDTDDDGLSDGDEIILLSTDPNYWDSDGDYLPDGFETAYRSHPKGALNPINALDGLASFDLDGMPNAHEYWNRSNPWSDDPVPVAGYGVGCYYWGKADGGPFVQPSDIVAMQKAYVGVSVDYAGILPSQYDPMDLDRDTYPSPGDISLAQAMYAGASRPSGYASTPNALTVLYSPSSAISVGDTTHITVSVHAAGPGTELYSPGMGVVFWVTSGNAVLLGGEGTVSGEALGNRYDVSMKSSDGAPANMVVLVTGAGPVVVNAKVPACGTEPLGRWSGGVRLGAPVVVNP